RAKFAANSNFIHRPPGRFQSAAGISNGRRNPPIPAMASGPEIWRGSGSGWRPALMAPSPNEIRAGEVAQARTGWARVGPKAWRKPQAVTPQRTPVTTEPMLKSAGHRESADPSVLASWLWKL